MTCSDQCEEWTKELPTRPGLYNVWDERSINAKYGLTGYSTIWVVTHSTHGLLWFWANDYDCSCHLLPYSETAEYKRVPLPETDPELRDRPLHAVKTES